MRESRHREVLVVLNVPPNVEEAVVDWLLSRKHRTGFTSLPVFGHSTDHTDLSLAEQVAGRQRRLEFRIQIAEDALGDLLEDAGRQFGSVGIHYWVTPLLAGGNLQDIA